MLRNMRWIHTRSSVGAVAGDRCGKGSDEQSASLLQGVLEALDATLHLGSFGPDVELPSA